MIKYNIHIFVCQNQRDNGKPSCGKDHGEQLVEWFKESIKFHNIQPTWRVNKAGCLGICKYGPTIVIYPEGTFYVNIQTREDVDEIVRNHLKNKIPVQRLLLENVSAEAK